MTLYKYSGAGNDFIVIDGRYSDVSEYRCGSVISALCNRTDGFVAADGKIGADGLMILSPSGSTDFRMEFFNPDGSGGMMCGNGGRCITAFADKLGIVPGRGKEYVFEAADGIHTAAILGKDGNVCTVRLKMIDPFDLHQCEEGWFVNTGTRHLVRFVDKLETLDVATEGSRLRHLPAFAPEGVNIDFVSVFLGGSAPLPAAIAATPAAPCSRMLLSQHTRTAGCSEEHLDKLASNSNLSIRTFEKGVEAETLACGTGIVAAAVVHCHVNGLKPPQTVSVKAKQNTLSVDILPEGVWLTGPAELICSRS